MPWRYSPVSSAARLGEHTGAALKACRYSTPCSANRWMFGVGTANPYGWTCRPVSCECR